MKEGGLRRLKEWVSTYKNLILDESLNWICKEELGHNQWRYQRHWPQNPKKWSFFFSERSWHQFSFLHWLVSQPTKGSRTWFTSKWFQIIKTISRYSSIFSTQKLQISVSARIGTRSSYDKSSAEAWRWNPLKHIIEASNQKCWERINHKLEHKSWPYSP